MHTVHLMFGKLLTILGSAAEPYLLQQIDYLKVENRILRRRIKHQIHTTPFERIALLKAGTPLGGTVRELISIVKYRTFLQWKRYGHLYEKRKRYARGRPRIKDHIRKLIAQLAEENKWGFTRILGEIRKLHIHSVSRSSIRNILKEHFISPTLNYRNDTWHDFIKRHAETLWACDFFTKSVWTFFGPQTFYILFYINIKTRTVHIAGITEKPNQRWIINATRTSKFIIDNYKKPKRLLRDGDRKFSKDFDYQMKQCNVIVHKLPSRSPNLNAYAESWVDKIKKECLNHFVIFGREHLEHIVHQYTDYYNSVRPHQGKDNKPLNYQSKRRKGNLARQSTLGGLLNHYYWE